MMRFPKLLRLAVLSLLSATWICAANYEAESATLLGAPAPSVVTDGAATPPVGAPANAVSGGYIYFNTGDNNAAAVFTVNAPTAGLYTLAIRYYVPNGFGDKFTQVLVDGTNLDEIRLAQSAAGAAAWSSAAVGNLSLSAGTHTVRLNRAWGFYYIDYVALDALPAPAAGLHFEAENGVTSGGTSVGASVAGFSGSGYVTGFTSGNAKLLVPVNLALTGQ